MSKLYGPDEGYEVVQNRSSKKTRVNKKKEVSQNISLYSTIRGKISELICDQEPVMSGPPFNPVVDLNSLSHEQFVDRAGAVITPFNPEGHPPPGVYSPTMRSLIDRLEVSRMTNSQSYASVVKDGSSRSSSSPVQSYNGSVLSEDRYTSDEIDYDDSKEVDAAPASPQKTKSPRKTTVKKTTKKMKVSFAPLDMASTSDSRSSQYAITQCRSVQRHLDAQVRAQSY